MMQPARQQRFRRKSVRLVLTERDIALLCVVFLLKAVRREHLERLFFTSVPRCNDRLLALFNAGYLDRYLSPNGDVGPILYGLGKAARRIVRAAGSISATHFTDDEFARQCKRAKSGLLAHTLAIADVYVAFRLSLAAAPLRLTHFLPEVVVRQEFDIRLTDADRKDASLYRRVTVAPDACFLLRDEATGRIHAVYAEVDRGDTGSQLRSKLHGYSHFLNSIGTEVTGTEQITVMFVTTGVGRARNLCRLAEECECPWVFVTSFAELAGFHIAAEIWRMSGQECCKGLIEVLRWRAS